MTRRRLFLSHVRCVAVDASAGLLVLLKLFFNRRNLRISNFLVVLMTSRARRDRNVRGQVAQGARARNVDVAGGAFHHVPALAAFMSEFGRNAFGPDRRHERDGRLVTAGTVVARRFQILPVTVEAGIVRARHGLESSGGRHKRISRAGKRSGARVLVRHVTNRAVVVIHFLVIESRLPKSRVIKAQRTGPRVSKDFLCRGINRTN